jgi:hypothetical protein
VVLVLLTLRRDQRHVEVGRGHQQLVLADGAQQHVGQERHRALAVGDVLREAEAAKELGLGDAKLHGGLRSWRRFVAGGDSARRV